MEEQGRGHETKTGRDEFVTMTEAQAILGVSKFKMWALVKEGTLQTFRSDVDRREKLIRRADLDALRRSVVKSD